MHIITRTRILEAVVVHKDCESALDAWYRLMKAGQFENFAQLKETFGSVDKVGDYHVFNIGGNKLRLIAATHYNRGKVYIRAILTHDEYDADKWKK